MKNDSPGRSWAALGRSWVALGSLLVALGRSWAALGRSWAALGCSLFALGRSLFALGRSWHALGRSWVALRPLLIAQGRPTYEKNLPSCERKAAQSNVFHYLETSFTFYVVLFVMFKRLLRICSLYLFNNVIFTKSS